MLSSPQKAWLGKLEGDASHLVLARLGTNQTYPYLFTLELRGWSTRHPVLLLIKNILHFFHSASEGDGSDLTSNHTKRTM
jgi:hypothetical protein